MIRIFIVAFFLAGMSSVLLAAEPDGILIKDKPEPNLSVDVTGVSVSQLADIIFHHLEDQPYVLSPDVVNSKSLVSANLYAPQSRFDDLVDNYFSSLGYSVVRSGGVVSVSATPEFKQPLLPRDYFVYRPRYRDVAYLTGVASPLFPNGSFSQSNSSGGASRNTQTVQSTPSASSSANTQNPTPSTNSTSFSPVGSDVLVYYGLPADIEKLKSILPKIDVASDDVMIDASVYEVETTKSDGSAIQLAMSLLKGVVTVGYGQLSGVAAASADNFISVKSGNYAAVVSALNSDTHFKVVSSPSVRVRSGSSGQFNVGQQVPVLSSTTVSTAGSTTQGVTYQDSGVIFTVKPEVRRDIVDLDISQELSNFVNTTTGVNSSPTLNKRSLTSSLSMADDTTIIIGGLTTDQKTGSSEGFIFLPKFLDEQSSEIDRTEIILVLHVLTLKAPPAPR